LLDLIKEIGSYAGLAAFLALGVLALLSFAHGRDIRRLREWAGSAPERDAERKEATSAIAAQRAEELRALEEARTAEHEAIEQREERRRRREEGLPEVPRGEQLRSGLSSFGERLAEPRWLVLIFVVMLVIVGGVAYALLNGSNGKAEPKKTGKQAAAAKAAPGEIEVSVLNGTAAAGLAAEFGEKVANKGFKLGTVTNTAANFEKSVVMYSRGHKAEATRVAKQLGINELALITAEIRSLAEGADVVVVVGEDNAAPAE